MGGVSGRLTLKDARGERRLDFIDGRVCYASSTIPEERLATWLTKRSLIPIGELRRILATSMLRRALFTDLQIAEGRVTTEDLQDIYFEFLSGEETMEVSEELGLKISDEIKNILTSMKSAGEKSDKCDMALRKIEDKFDAIQTPEQIHNVVQILSEVTQTITSD